MTVVAAQNPSFSLLPYDDYLEIRESEARASLQTLGLAEEVSELLPSYGCKLAMQEWNDRVKEKVAESLSRLDAHADKFSSKIHQEIVASLNSATRNLTIVFNYDEGREIFIKAAQPILDGTLDDAYRVKSFEHILEEAGVNPTAKTLRPSLINERPTRGSIRRKPDLRNYAAA